MLSGALSRHEHMLLIDLADSSFERTREGLSRLDARRVLATLGQEIVVRAEWSRGPARPVAVQLSLDWEADQLELWLSAGAGGVQLSAPSEAASTAVRIEQDLTELVRALYGSDRLRHDATRTIWIDNEPGPASDSPEDPWLAWRADAVAAAGQVASAMGAQHPDLGWLARACGTDKWGDNFYTGQYEQRLAGLRDRPVTVLEIGVGGFEAPDAGGESLRMWRRFFPRGHVVGLDLFDKSALDGLRLTTMRCDASDAGQLQSVVRDQIGPPDVIIDDGSHLSDHVLTAFEALFPLMAPGGLYVIEDLQTSYWPGWNGARASRDDPKTSVGAIKRLLDGLHHQDWMASSEAPDAITRWVRSVDVHRNIAFVEKGLNLGQTAPSWVRRDLNDMDLEPKGSMVRLQAS